ncbi:MAG TPA: feruloyl-CoA synthase [Hymenobacter sp.]|jgi:feruloyl-CoA synthase|uniref:feruloyl-CoA synthase n=1 Tax=Hymenobacter sp. TaxID=1898978 RepID=UPI002ED94A3D
MKTAISDLKHAPYRPVATSVPPVQYTQRPDGSILLRSTEPLAPHPLRMTERLLHWAALAPDRVFIAQREAPATGSSLGPWRQLTYAQTLAQVLRIAHWLLATEVSPERPVAILSENSIEHGLLCLAALHVGLPVSVIAPAYALRSTDFEKLRHALTLLTPGLIFAADGAAYAPALRALAGDTAVLVVNNPPAELPNVTLFADVLQWPVENFEKVEAAFERIQPETVAKILFTSGSTGLPKGVINTHENVCTNWQQITQTFPFMENGGLVLVDWLPWNHTFGGNHNFGLALYNGGTLYLDAGNPTPAGIATTVANLRECRPTMYCNVPKGFADLLPYLRADAALRENFFSELKLLFYAGAGLPQHVWDALEALAVETIGEKIVISTGLGCTESSPSALFSAKAGGFAGLLGVPVPAFELKLIPSGGKLEVRYRGRNVMPGYWRNPSATATAFDEEGFYCTGDALRFVDPADPNAGLVFDGRIAEDFKLNTGTWVSVGTLRAKLVEAGRGLITDAVITGHDQGYIGAIVFADVPHCQRLCAAGALPHAELVRHPALLAALDELLARLAHTDTGSASCVRKAVFADFVPQLDRGEITDKGSLNQRAILANYPELVRRLHDAG